MNNTEINQCLLEGKIDLPEVLPHWYELQRAPFAFQFEFGLDHLPLEPGVIIVRGPRQYGKSTWLESEIAKTIQSFGPGSALYLNGDEILDAADLLESIRMLVQLFHPQAVVKRLFVDEITAIPFWEKSLKRLLDAGELKNILIVTTGSKASDLRRGTERLPGRKGKLDRHHYIFTPISYAEFKRHCEKILKEKTLYAYLLSGGSPVAASVIARTGYLPDYIASITSDWVLGEFAAHGRSRAHLLAILQAVYKHGGTPLGQSKLARETGLANNSVAEGYIQLLGDLMCIVPAYAYDHEKDLFLWQKPCKYHFVNLLAAITWHPKKPRSPEALQNLDAQSLGILFEWAVAQELWRRLCIQDPNGWPDHLSFWQSKTHEIDFVLGRSKDAQYLEVKKGAESPLHFSWFLKTHPHHRLYVVNAKPFETQSILGNTLEVFLLSERLSDFL